MRTVDVKRQMAALGIAGLLVGACDKAAVTAPPSGEVAPHTASSASLSPRNAPPPVVWDERADSYRRAIEQRLGRSVELTLSPELQASARDAVEETGKVAAVVVVDVHDGAVLAAYSKLENGKDPLLQAIVPGCTFKPVLGLAALEEGALKDSHEEVCNGEYVVKRQSFRDFDKHGRMTLRTALATSCDTFFNRLSHTLGLDAIEKHAHRLGFGEPTGIELPEDLGLTPNKSWYSSRGRDVLIEDTIQTGTGHGDFHATPLHLARAYAALATGKLVPLHIVNTERPGAAGVDLPYKPEHLAAVREGLLATVSETFGTADNVAIPGLPFAGKTGSVREAEGVLLGLFAAYAPADAPEVAVVGLVRRGRRATFSAAPLVQKVLIGWNHLRPNAAPAKTQIAGTPSPSPN